MAHPDPLLHDAGRRARAVAQARAGELILYPELTEARAEPVPVDANAAAKLDGPGFYFAVGDVVGYATDFHVNVALVGRTGLKVVSAGALDLHRGVVAIIFSFGIALNRPFQQLFSSIVGGFGRFSNFPENVRRRLLEIPAPACAAGRSRPQPLPKDSIAIDTAELVGNATAIAAKVVKAPPGSDRGCSRR